MGRYKKKEKKRAANTAQSNVDEAFYTVPEK